VGGFGPLYRWLLFPGLAVLVVQTVRRRIAWGEAVSVLLLFVFALSAPATWWPRYILAAAVAALVAFALTAAALPRVVGVVLSFVFVFLACLGFQITVERMKGPFPRQWARAIHSTPEERDTLQLESWMWPTFWSRQRDQEIGPDDVIAYDQSTSFVGEFFRPDARGTVLYLPSTGSPFDYVERVRRSGARWVGVRAHSAAEVALVRAGAEFLFNAPRSEVALYRMPPNP
jgi:hypothetical protein